MFNGYVKFKNISSKTFPLTVTSPPQITHGERFAEEYTIPGRNGTLYGNDSYRASAVVTVRMALVASDGLSGGVSRYKTAYRQVMRWLQGTGKLVIEDSTDSYYEVQKVTITTDERVILRYGNLEVQFTVYPFEFLNSGDTIASAGTLSNEGDEASPLYIITGSGNGSISINGTAVMTYSVTDKLYIDTRREIAYDEGGNNMNAYLDGDYADLKLPTGNTTISATVGTLTLYPKWGFNL